MLRIDGLLTLIVQCPHGLIVNRSVERRHVAGVEVWLPKVKPVVKLSIELVLFYVDCVDFVLDWSHWR